MGLEIADILVLVVYLVGITLLGIGMARKVHTTSDFFMPRRFGKSMMMMHAFGSGTHSDQAVGVASKTFTSGLSGIWYQWLYLFATPFYWLIAPVMRRFRAITTADIFEARYDKSVAGLFAVVGMFNLMFNIGAMLKGSGAVITASTGGMISQNLAIGVMTGLFVIYGIAGGLSAAIVTDFIQGILTIIFSFLLLPFILAAVGGISGIRGSIADADRMFSLIAPGEIGFFYIVIIAINALVGIVTQPHILGNCAAGRTEMDGRVGMMGGNLLKRICTIAWCLTGLAAIAYFTGPDVKPDEVYGHAAREFLPQIMPGLLGVFLAALLASVMSSCDSFMIASSGLFTRNVYRELAPGKSEHHYVNVGRCTALLIVAGGLFFAYIMSDVVKMLEVFWRIPAMMGIAFWLGLFWRRTTVAGAWAATLAGFATWFLTERAFFISWMSGMPEIFGLPWIAERGDKILIYLPWQMVFYLLAGMLGGILVSLFSRPVARDKLDLFYDLTRTPVVANEQVGKPCTMPKNAPTLPSRKLIPTKNLEIQVPSAVSVAGFIAGWIVVIAIIGFFFWIAKG
jgi:Na+/proline symporter